MKKFISEDLRNLPDFSFGTDYSFIYTDYIDFGVGDPDLNTDPIIVDALYKAAMEGATHYDNPQGNIGLRRAICRFYQEEHDFALTPEEVIVTISGCQAMYTIAKTICNPGDEILIPSPYFSPYTHQIQLAGGTPVYVETKGEENFVINVNALRKNIGPKTKAIIINTPNNPTGACIPEDTLRQIYDLAVEKDLLVICDDIYTLYTYEEPFFPMVKYDPEMKHVITINSFSKDFVMTGWRLGHIVAHRDFIKVMSFINETLIYHAPTLIQVAAITALQERHVIQPPIYKEYKHRMFVAYERLSQLNHVKIQPPTGTFYLFPNVEETGLSSALVAQKILEETHVKVIDGAIFGPGGGGHLRLAVTVKEDRIHEAFDRIEKMEIFR